MPLKGHIKSIVWPFLNGIVVKIWFYFQQTAFWTWTSSKVECSSKTTIFRQSNWFMKMSFYELLHPLSFSCWWRATQYISGWSCGLAAGRPQVRFLAFLGRTVHSCSWECVFIQAFTNNTVISADNLRTSATSDSRRPRWALPLQLLCCKRPQNTKTNTQTHFNMSKLFL